ncbi:MAG: hypothetical protein JW937_09260, partial [Candidatus Omnitrophica bacterium]|nr:hypothetical protein [Candidatus Omnitrophota bacterium]
MSSSKFGFVLILALLWVFQGMSPEVRAQNPSDTSAYPAYSTHSILDDPRLSRRLSLDLRDTNIADAIRFLADGAGVNIAVSKNVGGRVTLSLSDVTVRDALDIILVSNDLALERRGDIYYVLLDTDHEATTGESWSQAKIVQVVKLEYAAASDILTVLETLKSESGSVVVDPDSGTVVILDTPEKLGPMMDAISAMEKERDTRVIRLQYADAEKVEEALTERLDSKGVGSIKASEDNNQLIVTTLPGRMDEILQIISELDVPDKQVLIEAKIVKVTLTPDYRMGIDWEKVWRNGKKHAITLGMNFPIPDPPAVSSFGN